MNHQSPLKPTSSDSHHAVKAVSHNNPQTESAHEALPVHPGMVMKLQHTIGNQAVQRLLKPSKAVPSPISAPSVQRFSASEHKRMGDDATKDASGNLQEVELATGYSISYGDMVALAGDHFRDIDQMRQFAKTTGKGAGTRGEIEYLLWDIHNRPAPKPNTWDKTAEQAADKRYYDLASNNPAHFLNPQAGDENRTTVEKADDVNKLNQPLNAGAGYSQNHMRAIKEAFQAGKSGKGIEAALAVEAFGAHYLTDAFSSGHLRTPRASVKNYWHGQLPMFNYNLKGYIAEKIAEKLETEIYGGVLTEEATYKGAAGKKGALAEVSELFDQKGYLTFGEVVSGALHDYDNQKGVMASVEGHQNPIKFQGDGALGKELKKVPGKNGKLEEKWVDKPGTDDQEQVIMDAVRLGKEDIVKALDAGKNGKSGAALVNLLDSLTAGDGRFPAERLLPKPDFSNAPQWNFPDWETLLKDGQFQEGFKIFIAEKNGELKKAAKELKDPTKRTAFENSIIKRLDSEPIKVVTEIINWVPDTGGGVGGHNQDDNSEDYVKLAQRSGAMATLTKEQRRKLIQNLFNGKTFAEDETMVLDLLDAADDKDVRYVIRTIGWDNFNSELEDDRGEKFRKKYPKAQYGARKPAPTK